MPTFPRRSFAALLLLPALGPGPARGQDVEREPINYSKARPENAVARLAGRLGAGKATLTFDNQHGYLRSLLRELAVPESSQVLVFSKTSMQRERIAPQTPRALYFNDDVYVGFCRHGNVMEVTAVDPDLGAVFYTVEQKPAPAGRPPFLRQTDACLQCHAGAQNRGFPGLLLRSLHVDTEGFPVLSLGSHHIDQTSPLAQRWGGWYVTGTHGRQKHLGNLVVPDKQPAEPMDNRAGLNVTDLKGRLDVSAYLTPHSDIVALMVLEHQVEMHNRLARASFLTRQALYEEAALNKELGRPADQHSDTTRRRIKSACEPVVQYLLMSGETQLTDRIQGTSGFASEFARRGPRDGRGRSLRDLDLEHRLFRYPCSYLIYGEAFDKLPAEARAYVWERLWDVLNGNDSTGAFDHLLAADRRAVLEILSATRSDLPAWWRMKG